MPPRKRTQSAPKAEPEQLAAPEHEDDGQQADAASDEPTPVSDDAADASAEDDSAEKAPAGDGGDQDPDDEDGDPQTVDKPHEECFPNGWPEGAFSVGCTHGTWIRKQD